MKILVVDDNNSITELLSGYLRRKGHDCITTNNGKEGLLLCLNIKFDAIILDLAMPEFTGKDFIESLTEEGKITRQKIILLTAMPLGNIKIDDRRSGICEVLSKPCSLSALLNTLESLNVVA
ncbi:MAG TPA: response regulator [Nitrosopumilaceae archaeon]|nr:response regulator [Nitrosopumilaceae archaeon]